MTEFIDSAHLKGQQEIPISLESKEHTLKQTNCGLGNAAQHQAEHYKCTVVLPVLPTSITTGALSLLCK